MVLVGPTSGIDLRNGTSEKKVKVNLRLVDKIREKMKLNFKKKIMQDQKFQTKECFN